MLETPNPIEEYLDDSKVDTDGMSVQVKNVEGGGSNLPDETKLYESRLQWLRYQNGEDSNQIWRRLAIGDPAECNLGIGAPSIGDGVELVFAIFPNWFINSDDDLSEIFRASHDGGTTKTYAVLRTEPSEDADSYAFCNFLVNSRWESPRNKYTTAWSPKSVTTLYRRIGEPSEVDKTEIRRRTAIPEDMSRVEADPSDYDWRLALRDAYMRANGDVSPVKEAHKNAEKLPQKLYNKVEIGVEEYRQQKEAEGEDIEEDELAMVINSLTKALTPGVQSSSDSEEE